MLQNVRERGITRVLKQIELSGDPRRWPVEPGIPGVTATLTYAGPDGLFGTGGVTTTRVTTGIILAARSGTNTIPALVVARVTSMLATACWRSKTAYSMMR